MPSEILKPDPSARRVDFYEFGPFRLDPRRRQLTRDGEAVTLTSKVFDTLVALVENAGRTVEKDALMSRLWPDTVVEEANLTQNVSVLRKVLGEEPGEHRYIATIPRRGYEFVAPVREIRVPGDHVAIQAPAAAEGTTETGAMRSGLPPVPTAVIRDSGSGRPRMGFTGHARRFTHQHPGAVVWTLVVAASAAVVSGLLVRLSTETPRRESGARPPISSLAVLPLANLSGDPAQEYFADGMTEALITDLSRIGAFRVISRTSVMRYKATQKPLPEIARELRVDGVVAGSVLRSGDRIRITAQLIHATDDRHLWAESYERDLSDVLVVQSEVARSIARAVSVKLTSQEQARLAAKRLARVRSADLAEREYRRCLELDPSYATAHSLYAMLL
jgi:TolB-like protein/DNA-binding winged helix-turn-helix (wHTH) protein